MHAYIKYERERESKISGTKHRQTTGQTKTTKKLGVQELTKKKKEKKNEKAKEKQKNIAENVENSPSLPSYTYII